MFQILEMLRERHEQYLLQILKIDKFGNYSVVDPLKIIDNGWLSEPINLERGM